jgi:hypothetical protein
LQELLGDMKKDNADLAEFRLCFWTMRIGLNVFVGLLIAGCGVLIWFLLHWEAGVDNPTVVEHETTMAVPIIITIIMMVAPVLFSWMTRYEC